MKKIIVLFVIMTSLSNEMFSQDDNIYQKDTIYLYGKNKFTYSMFQYGNLVSNPPELYLVHIISVSGIYNIKQDTILFSCDSIYKLSYQCSSENKKDSVFVKYIEPYNHSLFKPFMPNIYFLNDNDTIAKVENILHLSSRDSIIISKSNRINRIYLDDIDTSQSKEIKLTYLPDTLLIFAENDYYNVFHNKKFKLYKDEEDGDKYIVRSGKVKVYIHLKEPSRDIIKEDRYLNKLKW
ncbi:MAG: hypothetical protein LBO06_05505 [Bacteroidales bacterium]|jgi:hypothetical protein|nr:hypothetical protein [Bacteroidales bacterium]